MAKIAEARALAESTAKAAGPKRVVGVPAPKIGETPNSGVPKLTSEPVSDTPIPSPNVSPSAKVKPKAKPKDKQSVKPKEKQAAKPKPNAKEVQSNEQLPPEIASTNRLDDPTVDPFAGTTLGPNEASSNEETNPLDQFPESFTESRPLAHMPTFNPSKGQEHLPKDIPKALPVVEPKAVAPKE